MNGGTAHLVHSGRSNYGSGFNIELYVYSKQVYQDIANNYTRLGLGMYVQTPGSGYTIAWTDYGSYIGVDGVGTNSFSCGVSYKGGQIWLVTNQEFNVYHNSDGTKWATILWKWGVNSSWGQFTKPSGSFGISLTQIPRTSKVSCTDFNISSTAMINIERHSSSFTHTVVWSFGNATGTVSTKTSQTSIGWQTPSALFAQIPNATKGTGTITCYTYSGDTLIGTSTCSFNAFVVDSNPVVSVSIVDSNTTTKNLTGDENILVKYFSNAKIVVSATAKNSSSIKSYSVKCEDGKSSTSASCTFNKIESGNFTVVVTDSRGLATTITVNKTMINYIKLALTEVKVKRESSTSSKVYLSYTGQYYSGSFGSLLNTLTIRYRYRIKDGTWSAYKILEPTIKDNAISQSDLLIGSDFSYHNEYDFEIVASDKLITDDETKTTKEIKMGEGLFEIRKTLFGIHGTFESDSKPLKSANLNLVIGRTFFATCIECTNSPNNITFGYLLNISRNGTDERELYNKQFFFDGTTNDIYVRTQNNDSWLSWTKV